MTKHEAAVIWKYCYELLGFPIYTHEYLEYADIIKVLSKPDFLKICEDLED